MFTVFILILFNFMFTVGCLRSSRYPKLLLVFVLLKISYIYRSHLGLGGISYSWSLSLFIACLCEISQRPCWGWLWLPREALKNIFLYVALLFVEWTKTKEQIISQSCRTFIEMTLSPCSDNDIVIMIKEITILPNCRLCMFCLYKHS